MSYQIGQLRRNNISSYGTSLTYSVIDITTQVEMLNNIILTDKAMSLTGNGVTSSKKYYYLNFSIAQISSKDQTVKVYLNKTASNTDPTQQIKTCKIPRGSGLVSFEIIFAPNSEYNQIIFALQRDSEDYLSTPAREIDLTVNSYQEIYNVLSTIGVDSIKKIGVQGPPGLLMCINGEEIRVGRSGIYEMVEDVDVTFIGFIIKDSIQTPDKKDYFILDYQYE